ncbi:unnamed protein product [Prorocentrum cordatum]|uniref:Uncharacterized protein n=1 Tax=Prorocentrum cordatum TaxID=2364126 RepID=A0ABN9Y9H1_9DINO|nr:unnamed protein product [Polarella glacialis]
MCDQFGSNHGQFFSVKDVLIPLSLIFLPLVICMHATSASDWEVLVRALFMCGRHWASFCWKYLRTSSGFSAVDIECMYKMFMALMAVRTHIEDTHRILMYSGLWSASRGCLAAWTLDCKTTVRWNMFLSAVTCFTFWTRREELRADGTSSMAAFVHHSTIEVVTCLMICCASISLELCEKDRVKAYIESSQSGMAYRAVQRLLGVFCDAHLHICPNCNIISHSPHLLHLLGSEDGRRGITNSLHGCNFLRYVWESDQQRFQDFISAAAVLQSEDFSPNGVAASMAEDPNSGKCTISPATSIQVSLRKGVGAHPVPVELFLTYVADVKGAPEFLMGIRETCEALPREACTDAPGTVALQLVAAAETAREPGPDAVRVGAAQLGPRSLAPALAPLAGEQAHVGPAVARAHGRARAAVAHAGRTSRSSVSSSSRASSSSAGSCAREAGCVSSVCLRINSTSRGLRVEDMLLRFEVGHRAPRLKDWLPKEVLDGIQRGCQELVNQREYGDGEEVAADIQFGAMRFSRNGSTFLLAESAELSVDGPAAEPRDSGEESDCFNPTVYMKMIGVSKLRMPWQSVPQKVSRSLHTIDESSMDAACDGDVPTLRQRTGSF